MKSKKIENITVGKTWLSYLACIYGALKATDFWQGNTAQLLGETGMAFYFNIHKRLCPSSVTVYDWQIEHFMMMDRIGVFSKVFTLMLDQRLNGLDLIQEAAVNEIKNAIDQNKPVVIWAPSQILEFALIYGYDDVDQVFYYRDNCQTDPDPLLYQNLGLSTAPILFYQIVLDQVKTDPEKIYRDSLEYGLRHWQKKVHIHQDYENGQKGYDYFITALQSENFDHFGLSYLLAVYSDTKSNAALYLEQISQKSSHFKQLAKAVDHYHKIAACLKKLHQDYPFQPQSPYSFSKNEIKAILEEIRHCRQWEEKGMAAIDQQLKI